MDNNNSRSHPKLWHRYVDDTFSMFDSKDTANQFLKFLNSRHNNIKFTTEFEQGKEIPFSDILVINAALTTLLFYLFTGRLLLDFIPNEMGFIYTTQIQNKPYPHANLSLLPYNCSTASLLQSAVENLKRLLLKNVYLHGIISFNINDVQNKNKNKPIEPRIATVPKKMLFILLPYTGFHSDHIVKRLKSCVNRFFSFVNCKVIIFPKHPTHQIFLSIQGPSQAITTTKVIYKASSWNFNDFYIGKTK